MSVSATFQGFNIALDRTLISANALSGFDTEVGTPLPFLNRWDTRAFVGYYHYAGGQDPDVNGVRGRLEAQVNDNLSLHFSAQNDAVFGTTISGGIAMHFGARNAGSAHRGTAGRLDARVVRDVNVVINSTKEVKKETATDPTTGQPITVVHANSAAAAGGDGTVEKPFNTLTALQNGSAPNNILFLHANSTFVDPKLTLQNGQRLLGEGIDHKATSTTGTFLMARATTGTSLPILQGTETLFWALELKKNNEVSGLSFKGQHSKSWFIFADEGDHGTFSINRNIIDAGQYGVGLLNCTGTGVIQGNKFKASFGSSIASDRGCIAIAQVGGSPSLKLLIENNQFAGIDIGMQLITNTSNTSTNFMTIRNNEFTNTESVRLDVRGGTLTLQLRDNTGTGPFKLTQNNTGTFNLETFLGTNPAPFVTGGNVLKTTPVTSTVGGTINLVPAGSAGYP